ncbi:MAG: hypothetical protein B6D41_15575 [Chloroflexi bacterium UTCFX4]|nr:MAG: hypothetical protein B6D41_15575 [Chloroflexi bacterium UTCFX4]
MKRIRLRCRGEIGQSELFAQNALVGALVYACAVIEQNNFRRRRGGAQRVYHRVGVYADAGLAPACGAQVKRDSHRASHSAS